MKEPSQRVEIEGSANYLEILYRQHFQGALVRSGASIVMWFFALVAFLTNAIRWNHFIGITFAVIYLVLINPPTLLLLKHITQTRLYKYASLSINFLEIVGYTAIIYFLGGIEATYLSPIYAALVTYVGVVSPRSFPFIISAMCSAAFSFVLAGELFGFLPPQRVLMSYDTPWLNKLTYLSVVIGLLFVVAYISSLTGGILKRSRNQLREKNLELRGKAASLEEAQKDLQRAHQELEWRVQERTAELLEANDRLTAEIAERKRMVDALRESEEKYRSLADHANDAIFIAQDGLIKFPNPSTLRLTGYTLEDYAKASFLSLIHPDDKEMVVERHRKRLMGEDVPNNYSFRVFNKAGAELWVQLNGVLIDWEGRPAILCFLRDITPQKRLEAQVLQAQKMEAVGILAGGVAHDFNNLLQTILGYTEILLMDGQNKSIPYQELLQVKHAAKRGAELTKQLLTFSRKVQSKLRPVNLNQEVRQVENLLKRTIPKMIEVELDLADDLKPIHADPAQIEQILMNLAVNARDAMPGGGKITIQTDNITLDRQFCKDHLGAKPGQHAKLAVSDTGHGMDKDTLSHIFDPFFTTKGVGKGTGLGLAMVYGIIKSHGGYIDCISEKGKGATFNIYLPVAEQMVIEEKEEKPSGEGKGLRAGRETILMVDDEEAILSFGENFLTSYGYTILKALNGEDCLKIYKEKRDRIQLIILDLIMPGMGGHKCLEEIIKMNPDAKVVIASGYSSEGFPENFVEAGAKAFINKPYDINQIFRVIREVLDRDHLS